MDIISYDEIGFESNHIFTGVFFKNDLLFHLSGDFKTRWRSFAFDPFSLEKSSDH